MAILKNSRNPKANQILNRTMTTDDTEVESNVESQPYGSQASVSSSYMQHASVNDIVIMVAKPVFFTKPVFGF